MASVGQWEVVKNVKRKNVSTTNNRMSKSQKKKLIENMPRVEHSVPIEETATVFNAFLEPEDTEWSTVRKETLKTNGNAVEKNKKTVLLQKKKPQSEKKKDLPVKKVESQVTCEELQVLLLEVQARFPETPSIWLKDLASYLNVKVNIDCTDPVFSGKPPGYPTSVLPSGIHELLSETISQCTPQTLQLFFEHCINTFVQDLNKGLSCIGESIFLQCLGEVKPEIILNNIPKLVDLRNSYQNRHVIGMSILWTAGQVGLSNLKAGLEVWLKVMLPVLCVKAFSKYVVDYLDTLLRYHPNVKSASDVLGVREFFPILDLIYSQVGMHGSVQKQLVVHYPKLKALSYGSNPETTLHNYFPSFLARLQKTSSVAFRDELLSSLVECLIRDKHSYSVWRQLYTKHLVQSSILLQHLLREWDKLPSKFPRKLLEETLHTFRVTNEEMGVQGKAGSEGYVECVACCAELLVKMSVWRLPWRLLILFAVLATTLGVAYDVSTYGSFKASQIGRTLKNMGLLAVCEQAWAKITLYSDKSYRWLSKNVPVYVTEVQRIISPYIHQFWQSVLLFAAYVWDSTQGLRDWFNSYAPLVLHWVNDNLPVYTTKVLKQLSLWGEVLETFLYQLFRFLWHYTTIAVTWMQEHVFTGQLSVDNLQRLAGELMEGLQVYTKSAYQWVLQRIT